MFRRKKAGGERKHRAWVNSLRILFVIGGLLAVVIFQALTAMNTRQVKRELNETFEFMKRQLNKYENYVVSDKTKSLVRLLDKTQELARAYSALNRILAWTGLNSMPTISSLTASSSWTAG